MVIDDKLANQRGTEQLFSVKDAYAYLLTADTAHYSPYILRQCSLNEYLYPNLTYDEQRTETAKKEALDNYAWANGVVQSGQKIIDRGEIVDKETYNILENLRSDFESFASIFFCIEKFIPGKEYALKLCHIFITCFSYFNHFFYKIIFSNSHKESSRKLFSITQTIFYELNGF